MELSTQRVDKILEALAPSLAAEIERILQEAGRQQEQEFLKRLEAATNEAKSAVMQLAAAEKEKAVAELREKLSAELQVHKEKAIASTRETVGAEMEHQFRETLSETIDQMGADFAKQSKTTAEQWEIERGRLRDQVNLWRTYAEGQRQLAESGSQAEMLTRFLNLVGPFAGAVAIYVAKADGLALWKSRGKGAFSHLVSQDTIDPESFFRPIVVRGRTVAAVCARQAYKAEPLDFLSSCLARAIEVFGLKLQTPVPRPPADAEPVAAPAGPPAGASSALAASVAEEKLVAEARLTARILVSEIKLYNEAEVREGRAASDLYSRLQKQINHGRERYRQRVGSGALPHDYYHEELVRVLADGDPSRLGAEYAGTLTT